MRNFAYEPYQNQSLGAILQLMQEQGRIQADAIRQRGQIGASAAGTIGSLIANLPQQIDAGKAQQQERTIRALQIASAQHEQALQPVKDALFARQIGEEQLRAQEGRPEADLSPFGSVQTAPPNALPGVTLPQVDAREVGRPTPVQMPGVPATATTPAMPGFAVRPRTAEQIAAATQQAELAKALTQPQKLGPEETVTIPALGSTPIAANTNEKPPESDQGRAIQKYAEGLGKKSAKELTPSEYNAAVTQYRGLTTNPKPLDQQLLEAKANGDTAAATRILSTIHDEANAKRDPAMTALANELAGLRVDEAKARLAALKSTELTPQALEQAAQKYLATGVMESAGMGAAGAAQRAAIRNRAAAINPTAALALNQANYKADSANLTNLQKTEGTLSAFETTAGKNLDQFLSLADKIPDTGLPWLNTPVRLLNKQVVGSANMAAIDAARDVALREIARVTNDPKLSGSLTDSARKEVSDLSPRDATLPQIKAVVKVLKQDMANVHAGLNQEMDTVKTAIGGAAKPATPAAGGTIRARDPQGGLHEAAAGTPLPTGWKLEP